jgi:hypothetical protein
MAFWNEIGNRLAWLFRRSRFDQELEDEMRFHGGVHQVAEEQQPRAEQQDGYRQLPDNQRVAQRIARRSGLPAALLERAADSRARAFQRRYESGRQHHHQGQRHRVGQQHPVRLNHQLDRQRRGNVHAAH